MAELNSLSLKNDANLVSYWRMEGNSNDSKGTNNGTDTAITYNAGNGKFGQGAGFNGSSSGISVAANSNLTPSVVCYSFWINPTALPSSGGIMGIIGKRDNASGTNGYLIQLYNNSGTQTISIQSRSTSGVTAAFNVSLSTGVWSHLVFMMQNSSIPKLYVNSVEITATTSSAGAFADYSTPLLFGKRDDGYYFNGKLDDIALFSRALTVDEILTLYREQSSSGFFALLGGL